MPYLPERELDPEDWSGSEEREYKALQEEIAEVVTEMMEKPDDISWQIIAKALSKSGTWYDLICCTELEENIQASRHNSIDEMAGTAQDMLNVCRGALTNEAKKRLGIN